MATRRYGTFPADADAGAGAGADAAAAEPARPSLRARALLSFVTPVMRVGAARQLTSEDLWPLPAAAESLAALGRLQKRLVDDQKRGSLSLARALARTHGPRVLACGGAMAFCAACDVAAPALLRVVVGALAAPAGGPGAAETAALARWLALFVAARAAAAVARAHLQLALEAVGVQAGAALRMLLFRKALRRHAFEGRDAAAAAAPDLANLYAADVATVLLALRAVNSLWILPVEVAVMVAMLYSLLGAAALAGLAAIAASMAASTQIARAAGRATRELLRRQDRRMAAVKEAFGAVLAVKTDALEDAFAGAIGALRARELAAARRFVRARVLSSFVLWASPLLVSTATFAVYALAARRAPAAAVVFAALALFAALRDPLRELPGVVQTLIQAGVSVRRLEIFLRLPEFDEAAVRLIDDADADGNGLAADAVAIRVSNGAFGFAGAESGGRAAALLHGVDLEVRTGDLVVVSGPVGAGKSALCLALLGELCRLEGGVALRKPRGSATAFVPQQPWVQQATLRDNILFGRALEPALYARVLDACALRPDLAALPAGDLTEIGHKGVNLSGGQRARLALARACYAADARVVVLDAPLAAVDAAVQREVFDKCIAGDLLAGKTVVLATHNRDVVRADVVDCRVEIDRLHRVMSSRSQPSAAQARRRSRQQPRSAASAALPDKAERKRETQRLDRGRLVQAETRQDGRVSARVFREYVDAVGGAATAAVVLLVLLLWQACQVGSDLWLSHWTSAETSVGEPAGEARRYMLVYAGLTTSCAALVLVRSGVVALAGLRGSAALFERMTRALLGARVQFFDANPIGRVLNRYGEDVRTLDLSLPFSVGGFLVNVFMAAAQLLTAVVIVPGVALLVVPIAWVYARVAAFYLVSSREIGRLRKVAVSPVLSHVAQCEDGAVVLRAFGRVATRAAVMEHGARNDRNNRILLADVAVRQWFQLRVELMGCAVVLGVGAGVLLLRHSLAPGLAGLAFMYALNVDVGLSALVRVWALVEVQMVSAERVMEYAAVPPEETRAADLDAQQAPPWGESCAVRFRDVVFNYKLGDAPVLKGVTFAIEAGERVGVVGRTGAGKSSLLMALFRINELVSGDISIGGRDTATLPLRALRSHISMIAQAPVLFRGPLRSYLDPDGAATDEQVWAALGKVGMKPQVARMPRKLQHEVAANGDNLSVGERQLLSLARALLAGNRLVVFDEATAAVDHETERQLQTTIARELGGRGATVLTIAHRLATVTRSDRILVMRDGRVAEFAAPQTLLEDPTSAFAALARDAALLARDGRLDGLDGDSEGV